MTKSRKRRKPTTPKKKRLAIYHDMHVEEDFERCASRIFTMTKRASDDLPGVERILFLDVQGHRNSAGGYDHDAYELMTDFLIGFMLPYLTEVHTPLSVASNPNTQREDLANELFFIHDDDSLEYDHQVLEVRSREDNPDERASRPSVAAIADYLGMDPACLVCWKTAVERAHVVPLALGGSNDVRNFALLCKEHHAEAPDVADAESFWSWVDYAYERDHDQRLNRLSPEHFAAPGVEVIEASSPRSRANPSTHFGKIRAELKEHFGWTDADFVIFEDWGRLMDEYHEVVRQATSKHFGIDSKTSTEAWAFDIARRRLTGSSPSSKQRWRRHLGEPDPRDHEERNGA